VETFLVSFFCGEKKEREVKKVLYCIDKKPGKKSYRLMLWEELKHPKIYYKFFIPPKALLRYDCKQLNMTRQPCQ
jgi:hypothetical protein